MDLKKIEHLVVDSGAFIKNAPVHEYANNIYTVVGAIQEIKDIGTKQRLQFLPYALKVKEPSPDAYKHVLEFSKKTGDFANLSVVDLQIIALTYQLQKENGGTEHLHSKPSSKVTSKPCFVDSELCGFYYPKKEKKKPEDKLSSSDDDDKETYDKELEDEESKSNADISENERGNVNEDEEQNDIIETSSDEEDDDDESHGGWITPSNIAEVYKKMGSMTLEETSVCVACISTDFCIQNVLLQIGLHVISVNGMLIKNTRVFILRCFSCFKTINNTAKQFCPNCGNKTLKRVAVSYDEQGSQIVHINFKKPINVRGMKYSLPTPRGGKHAVNPILVEDQRIPRNHPSKLSLKKIDALSPDYDSLSSPFAINDVYSRAANLGIRSNKTKSHVKNPNEWSKRTGNRKRNK